ncbi:MAG: type II toxin-antitoxin system HicB family antitoxin [Thermoanaerobaculia bacterium]
MKTKTTTEAAEYLAKQYARVLMPDVSGVYVAQILEFPGCVAEGDSPQEAYEKLEAAAESWVDAMLRSGQKIPEPTYERIRDYGGKIALRLPRSVHRDAVRFAERESTSLNQFLVSSVSAAVGAMSLYEQIAIRLEQGVRALILSGKTVTNAQAFAQAETITAMSGLAPAPSSLTAPRRLKNA